MRVAFFVGSLNRGGTEMLLLDSFRRLTTSSFECILIYRNEGELSEDFRKTGIPMFRVKPHGLKLGYFFKLRQLLKKENIDILHAQTLINEVIGVFCVAFSSVKMVASFHGFRYSWTERVYAQFVIWNASASIFVSNYVRDWYLKNALLPPRKRCHVVYNGIDFSKFDCRYPVPDFLGKNNGVSLAMVGNFGSVRSQFFLCKSLGRAAESGCGPFQFYFIGKRVEAEPWLYDNCVRYCDEHHLTDFVHFVGSRGDVPAILQHIDGFVYASDHDTFGIAVVEAVASGRPVLVNDWVVMREVVGDYGWAEMYRTNDEKDCCFKIKAMINDIDSLKIEAETHKKEIRKKYSIEAYMVNLYAVYTSISGNKRSEWYRSNLK